MLLGDSKTAAKPWGGLLDAALWASTGGPWGSANGGVSGGTVAAAAESIATLLAAYTGDPASVLHVLCNWGVNDWAGGLPNEVIWKANYTTIIDAAHIRFPNALVWMVRPWDRGFDGYAASLAAWISDVQATRSSFARLGPDEAIWLKGADNGATMTVDGVHYSTAGNAECAAQWLSALGY